MKYVKEIRNTENQFLLREDGILEIRSREDRSGTSKLKHARENVKTLKDISAGKLLPLLVFLPDHQVSYKAQMYYRDQPRTTLAVAMITRSAVQKILGNFLMLVLRSKSPSRLFEDQASAEAWLKEEMAKQQKPSAISTA